MDENHTHEEFGELKNQYSLPQNVSVRDCFIPQMRENLIARNGGSHEVKLMSVKKLLMSINVILKNSSPQITHLKV